MTADKVVDASAIAALLLDETRADAIGAILEGQRLAAPALLYFELANACLKKSKAFPEKRNAFFIAVERALQMNIEVIELDFAGVLILAEAHRLSAYDASYLWLARELDAGLVTLDERLEKTYARMISR